MKRKLGTYLSELRRGLGRVVRRYPVEVALQTVLTALFIWWTEAEHFPLFPAVCLWVFPLFTLGALVVNTLAGSTPWRRIYWVVWAPIVPLLRWPGLREWVATEQFAITLGILAPLALLLCRRARDNRRFAGQAMIYLRAAAVALLFSEIACGLFNAVLWSSAYIFGFDDAHWVERLSVDTWSVANLLAAPVLFLLLLDRWEERECSLNRIGAALVNWIFTPALVIYAVMLHLYAARMLVLWSLPRGGVAYLVFGFVLLAFAVRMLRELVEKRVAEWFYGRFSCFLLVPMLLFWIGAARRVGEYGLTDPRIYLLSCGVVMSAAVVLFFFRRTQRYGWVCLTALFCFASLAFVPALAPQRLSNRSQQALFEEAARRLDLLDAQGALRWDRLPFGDTTQVATCRRIDATLAYLSHRDTLYLNSLGLSDLYWKERDRLFTPEMQQRINDWEADTVAIEVAPVGITCIEQPYGQPLRLGRDYRQLCRLDQRVTDLHDTLTIALPDGRVVLHLAAADLLHRQLTAAGIGADSLETITEEQRQALLYYRDERIGLIFDGLEIDRNDAGEPVLHAARLGWLLER